MSGNDIVRRAISDAQAGRMNAALTTLRALARSRPNDIEVLGILGLVLTQAGEVEQAIYHLTRAVELEPNLPGPRNNLANALLQTKRHKEAEAQWRKAVELAPDYARGWLGLVITRVNLDNAQGAIDAARKALELKPDWPELVPNYIQALTAADRTEESIRIAEEALGRHPLNIPLRSSALMAFNYIERTAEQLAAEHRKFGETIGREFVATNVSFEPDRPLRIGVLSGDLRSHSVGFFAESIFRHKPSGFHLTAFSSTHLRTADRMAVTFKSLSDDWNEVAALSDDALDTLIRDKRIDVLIELGGHTSGGRLTALNRKPAPLIITAIGYPNTTGHPAVDLRIVDSHTDPSGYESHCTERLLRLDPCFLSYTPPNDAPTPALPAADAPITFGSFNVISKVSPATLSLWKSALDACPGSRLLLKSRAFGDPSAHKHFVERARAAGIDPSRIEIIAFTAKISDHLKLYERVHVALDTTPYNGTTTTCEALWMGVPVITLAGDRHAARVGVSLLNAVGLPEFIAKNREEFATLASRIACDRGRLSELRMNLRDMMRASPLTDSEGWAGRLYGAIRDAWRTRCAQQD